MILVIKIAIVLSISLDFLVGWEGQEDILDTKLFRDRAKKDSIYFQVNSCL